MKKLAIFTLMIVLALFTACGGGDKRPDQLFNELKKMGDQAAADRKANQDQVNALNQQIANIDAKYRDALNCPGLKDSITASIIALNGRTANVSASDQAATAQAIASSQATTSCFEKILQFVQTTNRFADVGITNVAGGQKWLEDAIRSIVIRNALAGITQAGGSSSSSSGGSSSTNLTEADLIRLISIGRGFQNSFQKYVDKKDPEFGRKFASASAPLIAQAEQQARASVSTNRSVAQSNSNTSQGAIASKPNSALTVQTVDRSVKGFKKPIQLAY